MKYWILIGTIATLATPLHTAFAAEACLKNREEAQKIIEGMSTIVPLPGDDTDLNKIPLKKIAQDDPKARQPKITKRLADDAEKRGCEYSDHGSFQTLGETLDSKVNHFFKKPE